MPLFETVTLLNVGFYFGAVAWIQDGSLIDTISYGLEAHKVEWLLIAKIEIKCTFDIYITFGLYFLRH